MNLSDEIWLPANILLPDAPGSATADLELHIRVPMPADPSVPRKVTLGELLADAELVDYGVQPMWVRAQRQYMHPPEPDGER